MHNKPRRLRSEIAIYETARLLRGQLTRAEAHLWRHLRGRQLRGLKFRRQHPIGPYIADFFCPQARLVIEIDGPVHTTQRERDEGRTMYLEERGYRVIRFRNEQVLSDVNAVLAVIEAEAEGGSPDE